MPFLKVGIAGTHSTGKTTFVELLEDRLIKIGYRVIRVNDLAKDARDIGFPILREHTFSSTLWIMTRCITLELEASLTADIVLVDRPVPDALGYLFAALETRNEILSNMERCYLIDLVKHHSKTYNVIFKTVLDPSMPIGTNKPRDHDPEFRFLASSGIDKVFSELEIPFLPLGVDIDAAFRSFRSHLHNEVL